MDHLLQTSVRSVWLAAVAAMGLWRVTSAAVRHAVWTLVTVGMIAQIALSPVLPEIPLRVLTAAPAPVAITVTNLSISSVAIERSQASSWSREELAGAVYLCGLFFFSVRFFFALQFARRLARTSEPAVDGACESPRIASPVTIGSRILLPMSWRDWDSATLRAVLAHEQAHVRRRDWAVAAMARVNRCVFWFHPVAWWLERQLARLAEQASDDAALAVVEDRELYARTLLDVARMIQISRGRLLAAPMAKEANVETRIDRILDETRRIPGALGKRGWMALALCAAPVVYIAAAVQLAPAQTPVMVAPPAATPQPPPTPAPVIIAQVPAPQGAPVPPQPAEVEKTEESNHGANEDRLVIESDVANLTQAIDQQESELHRAQGMPVEQVKRLLETEASLAHLQAQLAQNQNQPQTGPAWPLQVSVTSIRVTKISIPLNTPGSHEVSARITTPENRFVTAFDELVDHGGSLDKNMTLKVGSYRLNVMVKSLADGSTTTQTLNFEVQ